MHKGLRNWWLMEEKDKNWQRETSQERRLYTFQDNVGTCLQREVYVHISLPGAKKELLAGETKKGRGLEKKKTSSSINSY